ncbi:hypothetical protein AAHH67_16085 [Niallia circulans]
MLTSPKLETEVTNKYKKYWTNDFSEIEKYFNIDTPKLAAFDSETTGLHIKKDKPFMWVVGWLLPRDKRAEDFKGRVFAFDHNVELLTKIIKLIKNVQMTVGHNVKYDLHMVLNGGVQEDTVYDMTNIADTMGICRLSFDAVSVRDGGDFLGLKKLLKSTLIQEQQNLKRKLKKSLERLTIRKEYC